MKRIVSIAGMKTQFDDETYKIFGRCLELFYITGGNKGAVYIMAEAEFSKDGMYMYGFVENAEVVYKDVTKFIVYEVHKETS